MQRRFRKRKPKTIDLKIRLRINHQIRSPRLRVIDESGTMLGDITKEEALKRAGAVGLDLVEVSPKAEPPVARIADYGQLKYEREKKAKKQKAQQKVTETKGVRLSFRIKEADLELRNKQAAKFLEAGHNVRVELILRGRERAHKDKAEALIKDFVASLGENIIMLQPLGRQGGKMSVEITKSQKN
jgi:translation initiation factor IF-3